MYGLFNPEVYDLHFRTIVMGMLINQLSKIDLAKIVEALGRQLIDEKIFEIVLEYFDR